MSNAPALQDQHHRDMTIPAPRGISDPTGGRLVAWAEGLAAAHRIASALCVTAFAPAHFKGKPEEAAAAILYGDEIGFTPTQSLQNLYVISGKPALYARAMVALVQAAGHDVWTEDKTDESVTVQGRRKGSSKVITETWDIGRAQRAGYTNNKKYQTDPQAMLYARAASDVCRQVAADVLAGIGYSVEEMQLVEQPAPAKPQGMAGLRAAVAPEDAREPVEYVQAAPEPVKPMTKRTQGQLFALFGQKGISEDQQLAGINYRVGGTYESRADVTEGDARTVIDYLKSLPDADQDDPAPGAAWGEGETA